MSRRARQERKKTIRVLLGLGLTTSAFAAIAGTIAWTWAPQIGNWTLSPQQDFAEYAKDGDSRGGRTWVPPEMPPVPPWAKHQPTETAGLTEPQSEESTVQVASVETKDGNSSGHGPVNYEGQNEDQNGNFFGLFSPGNNNGQNNIGGGGSGGSWNGTFNSNPPGGGGGSGFPNYAGGSGNGSGGNPGNGPKSFSNNPPNNGNPPNNNPGPDNKGGPDGPTGGPGDGPTGGPGDGPTGGPGDGPTGGPGDGPSGGPGDGPTGGPGGGPSGGPGDGPTGGPGDDHTGGDGPHTPSRLVSLDVVAVPEPGTLAMLLGGLLGLGWTIRRRA